MPTTSGLMPRSERYTDDVPAVAQGATNTEGCALVKEAGIVTAVNYFASAAITGADTNTRKVSLINTGQNGAGTTVVATLQFNSGINAAANDAKPITLSGTPANLVVAAGDVLAWKSEAVLTGIADPGGFISVDIARD